MINAWLPLAAYAAFIFTLSSLPNLAPPGDVANTDKLAHLVEYILFGVLAARALALTGVGRTRRFLLAVAAGAVFAALDELFQGTVGRQTSIADWGTDVMGVAVAALIDSRLRERRNETPPETVERSE